MTAPRSTARLWCRVLGHTWTARRLLLPTDPGDLICRVCGATTWSTR